LLACLLAGRKALLSPQAELRGEATLLHCPFQSLSSRAGLCARPRRRQDGYAQLRMEHRPVGLFGDFILALGVMRMAATLRQRALQRQLATCFGVELSRSSCACRGGTVCLRRSMLYMHSGGRCRVSPFLEVPRLESGGAEVASRSPRLGPRVGGAFHCGSAPMQPSPTGARQMTDGLASKVCFLATDLSIDRCEMSGLITN
jgi:hypothetical protein